MYVFRLKNIKLGNLKDAKNLTLKFSGVVDNLIRVKINGYEMDVNAKTCQTCPYVKYKNTSWAVPGWDKYSQFNADMKPGTVLKSESGVVEFYKECKKQGIKPIIGCEVYVARGSIEVQEKSPNHLILLVKNEEG